MSYSGKELSNPYSTGGGGIHFENRVQASFVVLMLTGGFSPCLPTWPINEIKLQGKYQGFDTDDLIIVTKQPGHDKRAKLLGQIKHSIRITTGDKVFGEVIQAAWRDFNNRKIFNEETDMLALITGPLSAIDTEHVRALLRQAQYSMDADDFLKRIGLAKFSSNHQRDKLEVFKSHLKSANGNVDLTDDQLWRFLKRFHLLLYDLDIKGVTHSLLHSLIGQYSQDRTADLLALIEQEITYKSENAGSITIETIPANIASSFIEPIKRTIPNNLVDEYPLLNAKPEWNNHEYASSLVFVNLLGSWNENSEGDKEIASDITSEDFPLWISKVREILQYPESPLTMNNGVWKIRTRQRLWTELGPRIFDDILDRFAKSAITVLTERNPKFALPSDQRFAASIFGKVLKYSESLRVGIAETLALLRSEPKASTNCTLNKSETVASAVVRQIFKDADWRLWGSLNNLLPLLAEAAPDEFLDAVEKALRMPTCPFDELFAQEGSGITGDNYLTGLLWALETLAWEEQFLVRVSVILAELSTRDPGGNWSNRPSNSLVTIFLPWFPQTQATLIKRKVAVQTISRELPEIAWKLLLQLLPNQRRTSSGSHRPRWSSTGTEERNSRVTEEEYWDQVSVYSELAVEMAKNDLAKLTELVTHLDHLTPPIFEKVLEHVSSTFITSKSEIERLDLWTELTKFILKHKRFSDTKWALKADFIAKIEKAAENISPINPINLYRILFSQRNSDLFEYKGNWKQQEQQLEKKRLAAVVEIINYGGIEAVFDFVNMVESPNTVGFALGFIDEAGIDTRILPELLDAEEPNLSRFASAFVWGRYQSKGWKWVDNLIFNGWSHKQIGQFFAWLPFTAHTLERVEGLLADYENEYWSKANVNPYQTNGELGSVVEKLIEYKRPNAAIECLYKMLHDKQHLDKGQVVRALLGAVSSEEPSYSSNIHHNIELIKELQNATDTNPDQLFQVEWAYLPLLDRHYGAAPKFLEIQLATDPVFFAQMIRTVYRSKNDLKPDTEPTENQKAIAENTYRLLDEWQTPPGLKLDGSFSGDEFKAWLEQAKTVCAETGHLEVALSHIGRVMFYCPPDASGLWINQTVAATLNERDSDQLRSGFRISVMNSRGVYTIDPTGKPEKELAQKYRQMAEEVENNGYHRFAITLRGIAETYELESERNIPENGG